MNSQNLRLSIAVLTCTTALTLASQAAAPAGRYTKATGTVYDTKTKLTWQHPATHQDLQTAGSTYCPTLGAGWRMPTLKELATLVDFSVLSGLRMDDTFVGSPAAPYWSSTLGDFSGGAQNVYSLDFLSGRWQSEDRTGLQHYLRCVK